ncbi:MAG: 4Fe-4S binding protein [Oscillospiraceae bacterium]|nr:4Fe-4S binding protein [Oscillospiraceae bacterium]
MNEKDVVILAEKFVNESPYNYIAQEVAIQPRYVGMRIYNTPIFAFGSVNDELYDKYKSDEVIGSHFLSPMEWLPTAKTVISFFLPYSEKINIANSENNQWPADEWLHGRYEGQQMLIELLNHIVKNLSDIGFLSIAPANDSRYKVGNTEENIKFTSNWSERHIAYACGLGTFGLSKGIITKSGMSGRLGSILTELNLPKNHRDYNDTYEYCTMCGACIVRCPVQAISFTNGKNSSLCSDFLDRVLEKHNLRYGCGKCQVGVPCESEIPR